MLPLHYLPVVWLLSCNCYSCNHCEILETPFTALSGTHTLRKDLSGLSNPTICEHHLNASVITRITTIDFKEQLKIVGLSLLSSLVPPRGISNTVSGFLPTLSYLGCRQLDPCHDDKLSLHKNSTERICSYAWRFAGISPAHQGACLPETNHRPPQKLCQSIIATIFEKLQNPRLKSAQISPGCKFRTSTFDSVPNPLP